MKHLNISTLIIFWLPGFPFANSEPGNLTVAPPEVGLYRTFDHSIENTKTYTNKFTDVELRCSYTSPAGKQIDFIGFFDGDGKGGGNRSSGTVWKLRFMPDEELIALTRPHWIGTSKPPYTQWKWTKIESRIGGPNFIRLPDGMLMRLPLNGLAAAGPAVEVATLTEDEATGANGMVVDDRDGSVYILVETFTPPSTPGDTKALVRVTSAGVKSTAVDFFVRRGAGDAAGVQNDLAIDQRFSFIYTPREAFDHCHWRL